MMTTRPPHGQRESGGVSVAVRRCADGASGRLRCWRCAVRCRRGIPARMPRAPPRSRRPPQALAPAVSHPAWVSRAGVWGAFPSPPSTIFSPKRLAEPGAGPSGMPRLGLPRLASGSAARAGSGVRAVLLRARGVRVFPSPRPPALALAPSVARVWGAFPSPQSTIFSPKPPQSARGTTLPVRRSRPCSALARGRPRSGVTRVAAIA